MFLAPVARRVLIEAQQQITFRCLKPLKSTVRSPIYVAITGDSAPLDHRNSLMLKPPHILVFGQDDAEWKKRIENIIDPNLYLVYTMTVQELQSPAWIRNCRLLWLSQIQPEEWPEAMKANLESYFLTGGAIAGGDLALVNTDLLAKAVHVETDDDSALREYFEGLGILCDQTEKSISKTEGYLITDKQVDSFFNGKLADEEFRISDDEPINDKFTPIRLGHPDRSKFNTEKYFQYLRTREIGRTILYTENVSTTMSTIRTIDSVHGAVAVATRQIRPVARGRNSWISPRGCAMYSVVLHLSQMDRIAQRMSFLQHLAALSIVRAIRSIYPYLEIAIKWPNDVYFKRDVKIAGILSTCTMKSTGEYYNYFGCGVNISNSKPLTCVNDLANSQELTVEQFIAVKLTQFERLLDLYEKDPSKVLEEYHANWLHTDEEVIVEAVNSRATIRCVDEDGFLLAEKPDGEMLRLQPDGNSFDAMKGLITIKQRRES